MAYKFREEIVGKRFLSVSGFTKLKPGKISDWGWRAGVIRACSHKDNAHEDLQVLVEYDDVEWHRREWISIYKDKLFNYFLVEQSLVWAERSDPTPPTTSRAHVATVHWPALTFTALVSKAELAAQQQPVEFLVDREIAFHDYSVLQPYQEWDAALTGGREWPDLHDAVRRWCEQQDGQRILMTTPSVLVGYRVEVYRAEGTTQWYTAVIISYNEATRDLTVTDDTVLELHSEDPAMVQMRLIGDGVVQSIMRGENVGITSRRSRSSTVLTQHQPQLTRVGRTSVAASTTAPGSTSSRKLRAKLPPPAVQQLAAPVPTASTHNAKESRVSAATARTRGKRKCDAAAASKEDVENKRNKKRSTRAVKKKVLEEAQHKNRVTSDTRRRKQRKEVTPEPVVEVPEVIVAHAVSEASVAPVEEVSSARVQEAEEESVVCSEPRLPPTDSGSDDSVILVVPQVTSEQESSDKACSRPDDDDVPLCPSSPYSRMELGAHDPANSQLLRFPDDRSDSGVSSLRSGSCASGDERSGSRSSALSSSDEPPSTSASSSGASSRSPLFVSSAAVADGKQEPVRVWRDPSLLLGQEPNVRHIHSVQHQTLLMSHSSAPASTGPPPPPAAASVPTVSQAQALAMQAHYAAPQHPMHHHPHLPPPGLYPQLPEMMWKQRYAPLPVGAHLHHHGAEELIERERERAYAQDRDRHERILRERREQEVREMEKQHKEREREREREKQERERQDRYERDQEKKRAVEQAEQAVHKHFEESLRLAHQKRMSWNVINTVSAPGREDERQHQLHQQRQLAADRLRHESRERAYFAPAQSQRPPPPAHSRAAVKDKPAQQHTALPKAEPNFNLFGYPAYQPAAFLAHEKPKPALKAELMPLPNPPPLMSDLKNSVIVKNETKQHHHEKPGANKHVTMYQYHPHRSPSQSPHHLAPQRHTPSPHHVVEVKVHHRPQQHSPHALRPAPHPSPPERYAYAPPKVATVASYPYYAPPAPLKAKVSSPAPPHIYGKPVPKTAVQAYVGPAPPPAHSSGARAFDRAAHAFQAQPLDLGVREEAVKRPVCVSGVLDASKKRRCEAVVQPLLARVSEPSPLIANAATTITTVVNSAAYCSPATTVTAVERSPRPSSGGSPTPACNSPVQVPSPPFTPSKVLSLDSDKSNSPGPARPSASSHPVHKLKKAWLQRHSGEDGTEDTTGLVGGGSCVTLPLSSAPTTTPVPSASLTNQSLSSVGSGSAKIRPVGVKAPLKASPVTLKDTSLLNGHSPDLLPKPSIDDSSSSDTEQRKTPPKRKPPKVKRKKGNSSAVRKAAAEEMKRKRLAAAAAQSESPTESDKESVTDKDSDSGASTNQKTNGGVPRKRGRRPKGSKTDSRDEPRMKKGRQDAPIPAARDPFQKPPVSQLKKTGESFLQDGPCFEVAPKLAKCRECRWTPNQRSKNTPNIFCRFYAFRRLRYTKNGQLAIAGFSDPMRDAAEEDLRLWMPYPDSQPADLDLGMARLLLMQVGDQFCDLLEQEKESIEVHMAEDKTIAWKRVVQGVREMCDVCETTLFNFHWACGKCGFVVCIDCYKGRKNGTVKVWGDTNKEGKDGFSWLLCTNRQAHEQDKLMLTQIIAGDSLLTLGGKAHEIRTLWRIPQYCGCPASKVQVQSLKEVVSPNGVSKDIRDNLIITETINGLLKVKKEKEIQERKNGTANGDVKQEGKNSLSWLADVALSEDKKSDGSNSTSDSEMDKDGNYSTLRELLIRPSHKPNGSSSRSSSPAGSTSTKPTKKVRLDTLDDIISSVIERSVHRDDVMHVDAKPSSGAGNELKHFVRRTQMRGRDPLPIQMMTLGESKVLYPDVPHAWLCDGRLLRLIDPRHPDNMQIFQDQWKRGQPVLVSDVSKHLDMDLWKPESFSRDFGDEKNDLINCMTGNLVPQQPMRKFWDGFEHFSKRLKDEQGTSMLLKLKDWPPGEDFAEMLPSRYADLMRALPMPEYTNRTGRLNLASRLPDCFVRPDLGPKMYNAYGSALHPTKGTTNLHLDISDAVNVMVYVGIPQDGDDDEHIKEAFRAIDEAGCDILTRRRVREKGELPGALWHIYHSRDSDKIRDLLNKVSLERGTRLEPHHDPIHDQSWYLDSELRERLYKEYGVQGYAIVQCLGDSVFIPAGAPHQVRNLHNCIKVAEDFVSPENISHCFHLTQEFRELTNDHTNHEDKLQIKNIIYHAVKDSLAVLTKISNLEAIVEKQSPPENGGAPSNAASPAGSNEESNETEENTNPCNGELEVKSEPPA